MYEGQTYDLILQRMLDRVPNNVDKREGSIIWEALAPAAVELAQMYIELDVNRNLSFVSTSSDDDLTERCAEQGVNRKEATAAIRQGEFKDRDGNLMDIPIGSRFRIQDLVYLATEQISTGIYRMQCERTGTIGNEPFGDLLPIQNIDRLVSAELTDVLIPGTDEETDEHLRERYYETVNEPPFGGNVADYKQKINGIDGVGATKVFPVWNGGGTVKCTIIGADWNPPSSTLVDDVQTIIDPIPNQGEGLGLSPIDHTVTITGVNDQTINTTTSLTLESGTTIGQVQGPIENVISDYLQGLRQQWSNEDQLIVRVALIDAAILTVQGVVDVENTQLNSSASNITLGSEEVPTLGSVTLNV